jgi:hypothetical protein
MARSDGDMRVSPGYRGAPFAKPRTDHIGGEPLIRATAVIAAILPPVGLAEIEIIRCG